MGTLDLTTAARELSEFHAALAAHKVAAVKREAELRSAISQRQSTLAMSADGIDAVKVEMARAVVTVYGAYASGGQDRASVVSDAIKQLATGEPIRERYGDLWCVTFGTKNYDGWRGQRSDHSYGCGPSHGHTVFSVGLMPDVRKSTHAALTPEQVEAAIYYLTNLERIQAAEASAAALARAA